MPKNSSAQRPGRDQVLPSFPNPRREGLRCALSALKHAKNRRAIIAVRPRETRREPGQFPQRACDIVPGHIFAPVHREVRVIEWLCSWIRRRGGLMNGFLRQLLADNCLLRKSRLDRMRANASQDNLGVLHGSITSQAHTSSDAKNRKIERAAAAELPVSRSPAVNGG